jgi:ATP-dependent DNA ligase
MSQDYTENIMLFDIVEKDGQSLIDLPYIERIQKIPKFGRESLCMVI